jgi:SAM-dependent methyltransferase
MNPITTYWRRWNLRRAYAGDVAAMNRLYLLGDPWGLDAPDEHFRFRETVRVIQERLGNHFERILEIGCGEGLQTEYFAPLTSSIVGLDASKNAIKRARARNIANASFEVGDLANWTVQPGDTFDLVTACEVLYYFDQLEPAYEKLGRIGRSCLVTYHQGAFDRLDEFFAAKGVNSLMIQGINCAWRAVYWHQKQ